MTELADYVIGAGANGRPVRIALGVEGGRHALLLGASGSGKSNALVWIALRHIEAGFGCVIVDMKGDLGIARRLELEAVVRDCPFYQWSLDGGDRWNPLAHGNASERKDKLIGSETFSEPHYKRMYERYLLNLFRVLDGDGADAADLARVVPLLDPDLLLGSLRALRDDRVADEVGSYLDGLTSDQRRHLGGLADRLSVLVEGGHGDRLREAGPRAELIDLERVISGGGVALFTLNSSRYPETAPLVGNLVIQDLKAVCGRLEAVGGKRPALVAIDEFSALSGDHVVGLFQRARSARLSLLVATQELADLRRVDRAFEEQVIGNVELVLAGRQNNPGSAALVAELAGSEQVWQNTYHGDGRGRRTERISRRLGPEPLVDAETIKRLDVGRAVLVEKNPHRVELVSVAALGGSPPAAPLTGWLAARRQRLRAEAAR